jgi:hypothetical protein
MNSCHASALKLSVPASRSVVSRTRITPSLLAVSTHDPPLPPDEGEDSAAAAAREVEEETGWRPRGIEFVMSSQPVIGNADYPQDLYLAHGAELVGEPEVDETAEVRWVPVGETSAMIAKGEILGAITIIGVQHALLRREPLA